MLLQRDNWINGKLAGGVQNGAAAATDVADFKLPLGELSACKFHVRPRAAAADGDDRWMLAKQNNDPPVAPR